MARKGKGKIYIITLSCSGCGTKLLRYKKEGPGRLMKCYKDGITKDSAENGTHCPKCNQQFGREGMVHGRPAIRIIQGKVRVRGHVKK